MSKKAFKSALVEALKNELTEERTDVLIAYLSAALSKTLPFYLKPLVPVLSLMLDRLLPDVLLAGLERALTKGDDRA